MSVCVCVLVHSQLPWGVCGPGASEVQTAAKRRKYIHKRNKTNRTESLCKQFLGGVKSFLTRHPIPCNAICNCKMFFCRCHPSLQVYYFLSVRSKQRRRQPPTAACAFTPSQSWCHLTTHKNPRKDIPRLLFFFFFFGSNKSCNKLKCALTVCGSV